MKTIMTLMVCGIFFGCNMTSDKKENNIARKEVLVNSPTNNAQTTISNKETYLCKINGKAWGYTEASGIISKERKPNKRIAFITFKKKLEKGSESIQLRYDAETLELSVATLQLKFKNKDGKAFTCYYDLSEDTKNKSPNGKMSGNIDLSDSDTASGTATIANVNIKYEAENLENPENTPLQITDLSFSGVGYSDIDKLSKTFNQ